MGYVGDTYGDIGAGVDLDIGVVDAAGSGQTVGGTFEKVGPAKDFEDLFGCTVDCTVTFPIPPPERARDSFASPLAECSGRTAPHPTSFASAWLISGRWLLPGLEYDSVDGRCGDSWVNFAGITGPQADSRKVVKSSLSG